MTDAYSNDAATSTGTIADTTNNAASGAPQRAESTERLARPLIKLAKACGLATSFIDQLGTYTEISDAALVAVLKALDVDASSDEAIVRSMTQLEVENSKRLLPSTIVATTGKPTGITLNCSSDADITASRTGGRHRVWPLCPAAEPQFRQAGLDHRPRPADGLPHADRHG